MTRLVLVILLLAACEDSARAPRGARTRIVYAVDTTEPVVLERTVEVLSDRARRLALRGATVRRRGGDVVVELPSDDLARARDVLVRSAVLELTPVDDDTEYMRDLYARVRSDPEAAARGITGEAGMPDDLYLRAEDRQALERYLATAPPPASDRRVGYERVQPTDPNQAPHWRTYLIHATATITGAAIAEAEVIYDPQTNRPEVRVTFDRDGAEAFARLTTARVGHKVAIVLDGTITSAPVIQSSITGGRAQITMGGSDPVAQQRDAEALALVLESGALPAALLEQSVETIR